MKWCIKEQATRPTSASPIACTAAASGAGGHDGRGQPLVRVLGRLLRHHGEPQGEGHAAGLQGAEFI
jgi:hypothetical protein